MNIVNTQIMQYPLISEYVDAIRSAEDNLDKLRDLRPVFDSNGTPIMSSGNFAVVFKMKDVRTGRMYAVKCFTREQEGREEAYRQIADELEFVQSSYLAKVRYYDHELFVDTQSSGDSEFPVLLMDWVEGETLDKYIRQNINDTYALEMLAYNFSRLAMWLLPQPFAHGDLKPDNILVHDDGSLTLVDYDGMYVPAMKGQKSRELGSPDFRHTLRTEDDFNEHIDDFPAISILLSLRLIASNSSLLDKYGAADRLLFSESDYRDLSSCELLKSVFPSQNAEINTLVSLFTISHAHNSLANISFRPLAVAKPNKIEREELLSTKVTKEDLVNAVEDESGAKYSKNNKRLLWASDLVADTLEYEPGIGIDIPVTFFSIMEGTKIICDLAFYNSRYLEKVDIPFSVEYIGDYAFAECPCIKHITISKNIKYLGLNPFRGCNCNISCESKYFNIENDCLFDLMQKRLIVCFSNQEIVLIPDSIKIIGQFAFYREKIDELMHISRYSVYSEIHISSSVERIEDYAFYRCEELYNINIPKNVKYIGNNVFEGCKFLTFVYIDNENMNLGTNVFKDCSNLRQIFLPKGKINHFKKILPEYTNILYEYDLPF